MQRWLLRDLAEQNLPGRKRMRNDSVLYQNDEVSRWFPILNERPESLGGVVFTYGQTKTIWFCNFTWWWNKYYWDWFDHSQHSFSDTFLLLVVLGHTQYSNLSLMKSVGPGLCCSVCSIRTVGLCAEWEVFCFMWASDPKVVPLEHVSEIQQKCSSLLLTSFLGWLSSSV